MLKTQPWQTIRRWNWYHFRPEADQEVPTQNMPKEFALCPRTLILKWLWCPVHWHSERLIIPSHGKKKSEVMFVRFWRRHSLLCCTVYLSRHCLYLNCCLWLLKHWSNLSFAHRNGLGIRTSSLQTGSLTFYIIISSIVGQTMFTSLHLINLNLRVCFCTSKATV